MRWISNFTPVFDGGRSHHPTGIESMPTTVTDRSVSWMIVSNRPSASVVASAVPASSVIVTRCPAAGEPFQFVTRPATGCPTPSVKGVQVASRNPDE